MATRTPPEPPEPKAKDSQEADDDALAELRAKLFDAREAIDDALEVLDREEE